MQGFVAPTDHDWYRFLRARPHIEEVNFWRPGGGTFKALQPGEPFFFKLKAPHSGIAGFGQFSRFARLPLWMSWDVFGEANGVPTPTALTNAITRNAHGRPISVDSQIGCIAVAFPVFFPPDQCVPVPNDWKGNIVSGRGYDIETGPGRELWERCVAQAVSDGHTPSEWLSEADQAGRFGAPTVVTPRLGQSSFRLAVLDAYGDACAVTTEHSLPVLEAAHIRPYAVGGAHEVSNGLPLRRDLHRLFDLGFVTVRTDGRFAVSRRLRDDYTNGRVYYELEGREILIPPAAEHRPDRDALEWHGDVMFRR